ncbi:MAG: acetyltransferase [Dechloromonas sp.]|uniref:acetyltransferase n=1 Tax=Azonexus hydrophilus TaxID=418702 RepID=UPI0004220A17|nr:acetyltransferase [Azonexus hydrophilus]MCA1938780.1 acetyltransferase [Dechloromonas sp.]
MSHPHLFIYGAGAFGKEIRDIAQRANRLARTWNDIFFIDDFAAPGTWFGDTQSFSLASVLENFDTTSIEVVVAQGEPVHRETLHGKLTQYGIRLGRVVDPSAIVSPYACLGEGVVLTAFCSVAADAKVGNNVAVNVQAIIGHDVVVGDHTVISSMVNLGGGTRVGSASYIGMGSQIKEQLRIGDRSIVGMGSVLHHDLGDDLIALGNPARAMRKNETRRVFNKS